MSSLKNKVALVTGSSRGIGAGIARRLARDGAKVVLNYARDKGGADAVVAAIRGAHGEATVVQADVGDEKAAKVLVEACLRAYGRLDIVVNNAGIVDHHPLAEITPQAFQTLFDVNVRGPLLLTVEAAKHLPDGGRIVNISSVASTMGQANGGIYAASKAALEALTRAHAAELGTRHITVNAVAPGLTETEMVKDAFPAGRLEQMIQSTPLRRIGKPEDIAAVVAFLVSDDGRWVTGQVISASGGRAMR